MSDLNILSYFLFGYDMTKCNKIIDLSKVKFHYGLDLQDYDFLLSKAHEYFVNSLRPFSLKEHIVVPLSGGLDSRSILSVLGEFRDFSTISTYTFGTPGTYDFDIGNLIARKLGTKHRSFIIDSSNVSDKSILFNSKYIKNTSDLIFNPPIENILEFYRGYTFINGFFGGELTGSQLKKNPSVYNLGLEEAKYQFLLSSLICYKCLSREGLEQIKKFTKYLDYIEIPLSKYETIEILNRRNKYSYYLNNIEGTDHAHPFTNCDLMGFFLSLPVALRTDQKLYKDMLGKYYSGIFSLPIKNFYGGNIFTHKKIISIRKWIYKFKYKFLKIDSSINYFSITNINPNFADSILKNFEAFINILGYSSYIEFDNIDEDVLNLDSNMSRFLMNLYCIKIIRNLLL